MLFNFLRAIREKFKKHALTLSLKERASSSVISLNGAIEAVKDLYPGNNYADKTWHTYTIRLCRWLELCGFIEPASNGWVYRDQGDVVSERAKSERRRRKSKIFTAPASPALTLETLSWLAEKKKVEKNEEKPKGYRNALLILTRFELVKVEDNYYSINERVGKFSSYEEAIWISASAETALLEVQKLIESDDSISGKKIGNFVAEKYDLSWTDASKIRNGGSIRQWASWLYQGKITSSIPKSPGRV